MSICLCMIVKNESKNIEKCLQSVVDSVDHYVICDTGSSDGTAEVTENFMSQRGKEGKILHHEWVDFGTNRTWALDACRGRCKWAVVIDADDWVDGRMDTSVLDDSVDGYRVKVESESFSNHRVQILNMKRKHWVYRDPIHEYPHCDGEMHIRTLEGDYIWRTGVHGCRSGESADQRTKYMKDYRAIEKYLLDDPGNSRMRFYLGQSAFDAGEYGLAETAYQDRINMGGWRDEVFYSWHRIAACREHMKMPAKDIIDACAHAIEMDHERAEPYVQASRVLRMSGMPRSAYAFASSGVGKMINREKLFVHKDCYLWRIYDEVGTTAYYAGKMEEGRKACERLLTEGHLPAEHIPRVESNLRFYS